MDQAPSAENRENTDFPLTLKPVANLDDIAKSLSPLSLILTTVLQNKPLVKQDHICEYFRIMNASSIFTNQDGKTSLLPSVTLPHQYK